MERHCYGNRFGTRYSSNDPSTTWMKVMCPPPFGPDEKVKASFAFHQAEGWTRLDLLNMEQRFAPCACANVTAKSLL